jgi:hypothetical protein
LSQWIPAGYFFSRQKLPESNSFFLKVTLKSSGLLLTPEAPQQHEDSAGTAAAKEKKKKHRDSISVHRHREEKQQQQQQQQQQQHEHCLESADEGPAV